jgi:hypothetical protein
MKHERQGHRHRLICAVASLALTFAIAFVVNAGAQGRGGQRPADAQSAAPVDFTGYWVSLVTEDWRYRMVTPEKGDFASVPLNAEGKKIVDAWDPAKDAAEGNACKAYGAAAIMRVPGRFRFTWQDANTLKIETDAGQQTRLLHFGNAQAPGGLLELQGFSAATWEFASNRQTAPQGGTRGGQTEVVQNGDLRVVTTHLKSGYYRKNGVPYSDKTEVTEYFDRHSEFGNDYMTVTTIVHDPTYLVQDFITSSDFKKEADGSMWHPVPCRAN